MVFPRVILLLMNTFDLEEGSLTADNLSEMKDYLMATHPREYAQLSPQLKNCSLEAELDTVSQATLSCPHPQPRQHHVRLGPAEGLIPTPQDGMGWDKGALAQPTKRLTWVISNGARC